MTNSNRPLLQGDGIRNPNIGVARGIGFVVAVTMLIIFIFLAFLFRETILSPRSILDGGGSLVTREFGTASYICIAVGIFGFIYGLYIGNAVAQLVAGTGIRIFANRVDGVAVDADVDIVSLIFKGWGNTKHIMFDLSYNKITNVDITDDNAIIINASGIRYKCFVTNGAEIQRVIKENLQKDQHRLSSQPIATIPAGKFCSKCGYKMTDASNAAFCPGCGAQIGIPHNASQNSTLSYDASKKECSKCKKTHDIDSRSCPHCGYHPMVTTSNTATWRCKHCNEKTPSTSRICRSCGKDK